MIVRGSIEAGIRRDVGVETRVESTQGGCRGALSRAKSQRVIPSQAISTSFHPSNILIFAAFSFTVVNNLGGRVSVKYHDSE